MTDQQQRPSGSFMNAFLPGLVLGLIVGGLAGAVLSPMMEGTPKLTAPSKATAGTRTPTNRDREMLPPTEADGPQKSETKPDDAKPADQAAEAKKPEDKKPDEKMPAPPK